MSIDLEQLKTIRDQAESKMVSVVREANEAKVRFMANRKAYDEWEAKKNASSRAMAEFETANTAYQNAMRQAQPVEEGDPFSKASRH
jgi:hypothetical protein